MRIERLIPIEVVNPVRRANALQMIFATRRGGLRLARVEPQLTVRDEAADFHRHWTNLDSNRVLRVAWERERIDVGRTVTLFVDAKGEHPRPVRDEWVELAQPMDAFDDQVTVFRTRPTPYEAIFCWRDERSQEGPFSEHKQFFTRIDRETLENPPPGFWSTFAQVPDDLRAAALADLPEYLLSGFRERRTVPLGDDPYDTASFTPSSEYSVEDELAAISTIFETACSDHLEADVEVLHEAFDLFVRAQLMLSFEASTACDGVTPGDPFQIDEFMANACQPNSGNYVFFAELAAACIHHGVSTTFWKHLLPTLAFTIKPFALIYGDPNLPTTSSPGASCKSISLPSSNALSKTLAEYGPKTTPAPRLTSRERGCLTSHRSQFTSNHPAGSPALARFWRGALCKHFLDPKAPC